ncbi:hypothetical protein GV827_22850 [Sulfitobacter sp. JBTF-M27]|uniref:Tetratricopeptide repeat protein n=2 Tax=Sulfitobacter sediminilitoris TaxID=2698830 RepID=A0A6P0CIP3_9RHOB|nr:hypothetical protein [Sulfitobacter sediminilitoris]NEK25208.1 hypothetical protein [Sulfitobacter sediminilitoris]
MRCYEPASMEGGADGFVADYKAAFSLLEVGDPKARQAFAALAAQNPDDALTLFHLVVCSRAMKPM